ncbi:molybdopterin-dependent oxidoreductase [Methanobacterium petrolearium]|uniref:molybdopterin-dependent oxidoreductase n=1 Tax=Methanobacterium petrolearium TaxID=710190 RepID=UPI001AE603FF|nr:molybdopterin-dependent oxidoreductase [Methanobacterium petrolearium]MBP1944980.1 anaerobic selenocysteine-containing dehydrogenase [Methanobacterium petrolearium]BDZ70304.1 catalytic subunit of nitrate reductase (flp) [Methanobacterium petrolearium]
MRTVFTTCTRDCPGACSIIAQVEEGKIVKLRGNPNHDITSGFLCKNTAHYLENYFYSDKRILHPLLKVDGDWKRISWNEALEIAASQISKVIKAHGSQSILYYQGFGARTALQSMNKRFFNLLGGVTTTCGTVCGGIGHTAMTMDFGEKKSHDPLDHLNSEVIIIWGRNPAVTDVHLWRILRKAKRSGSTLIVIDPVKTKTAKYADFFIQPAPGNDHYLAMAIAKIIMEKDFDGKNNHVNHDFINNYTSNFHSYQQILDEYSLQDLSSKCDVKIPVLEKLAFMYADGNPSSIVTGWGVHRYLQGHLAFRMIDALAAITGNIGVSGGGVSQGFEEYEYFDFSLKMDELCKPQRQLPMPRIGETILSTDNPPIKLIFIASGNPINLNTNSLRVKEGFESVDFVVMIDHFLNDTSDSADLFLPATTYLEEEDLMGSYGHNWVSPVNPVIPPRGETKSEFEIFQLLADKLGFGDEMSGSPKKWLMKLAEPILNQGIIYEDLCSAPQKMCRNPEIPFSDGKFETESGKFEFIEDFSPNNTHFENYPLRLLSTMHQDFVGSVVPEDELADGFLEVQIHPDNLQDNGLNNGDNALLESPVGNLMVKINANEEVRNDYILTYKGGWLKYNKCVNVLTQDAISEVGEGTPYYDTWVRITPLK